MATDYLGKMLDPVELDLTIKSCKRLCKQHGVKFDAIACSGVSGTIFAGALSLVTKKPVIIVRKDYDNSHSFTNVEYVTANIPTSPRILIVDDLIASGATVRRITSRIKSALKDPKFVGIFLYQVSKNDAGRNISIPPILLYKQEELDYHLISQW